MRKSVVRIRVPAPFSSIHLRSIRTCLCAVFCNAGGLGVRVTYPAPNPPTVLGTPNGAGVALFVFLDANAMRGTLNLANRRKTQLCQFNADRYSYPVFDSDSGLFTACRENLAYMFPVASIM